MSYISASKKPRLGKYLVLRVRVNKELRSLKSLQRARIIQKLGHSVYNPDIQTNMNVDKITIIMQEKKNLDYTIIISYTLNESITPTHTHIYQLSTHTHTLHHYFLFLFYKSKRIRKVVFAIKLLVIYILFSILSFNY